MNYPPKIFLRFFRWFCHPKLRDSIEGDLMELYEERIKETGKSKADLKFVADVFLLFRPGIIRPTEGYKKLNNYGMFKNYFKISFRYLIKNKSFTAINVFGLATGFLCFLLIVLYIQSELSFDLFHRDAKNIYRIIQHEQQEDGTVRNVPAVAYKIAEEAATQFSAVKSYCRITAFGRITMGNDPLSRGYERVFTTDSNFFQFFDFPLLEGDATEVLKKPNTVVLSEKLAKRYFGNESPVGRHIWTSFDVRDTPASFTVSGVMKDFPKNSHLQLEAIFSDASWVSIFRDYPDFLASDWDGNDFVTYVKLHDQENTFTLAESVSNLVQDHYPTDKVYKSNFSFQPLAAIHLYSESVQDDELNANTTGIKPFYLYMFGGVGLLLLLIACLNYMNLTTAATLKRTKEIGMRKSLGAHRTQIVSQFIMDSLLMATVSLLISLVLLQLILPLASAFTQQELTLQSLPLNWILSIVGIVLLAAIISATYPAFVSLRLSTIQSLKGEVKITDHRFSARKILLVVQFAISIIMIASTLVIHKQLTYMRSKDIGLRVEGLLVVDINSGNLRRNFETVKTEFAKVPEVLSISTSTRVPGEWKNFPIAKVLAGEQSKASEMIFLGVDEDFFTTYNMKLKEGRNFVAGVSDSSKVILTEAGVKQLGLMNPLGQIIEIPAVRFGAGTQNLEQTYRAEVIGVVEDIHFESLRSNRMPIIFGAPNTAIQRIDYYTLKVKTNDWSETLAKLKEVNLKLDADNPMEYTFLDRRFEEFYQADAKRAQLFLAFSFIIVLITCLGLFALVSYAVENKKKEIGVRKVLGASVNCIVQMISKEFLRLVIIAGVLGLPIAWYCMRVWLQEFAYQTSLGMGTFISAIVVALAIAFITISLKTIRAASVNPVKSLGSE